MNSNIADTRVLEVMPMDCPICNQTHMVEKLIRTTQALIKGEVVTFDEIYFFCSQSSVEDECEFVTAGILDENLLNARNAYRVGKKLLTSFEIAAIRKQYNLTQSEFSALLGWGEVTVARYETKNIQDETYDKIMRMVGENPAFALKSLKDHIERFTPDRFMEIKHIIQTKIEEFGIQFMNEQEIMVQYAAFDEPSELNGFQVLDLRKVGAMITFFANELEFVFKIKLMKLLWYADALAFSRFGKAISGLVYCHQPFGAVPFASKSIIYLPGLSVYEEDIDDQTRYRIQATNYNVDYLSSEEQAILSEIIEKFKNQDTKEIVDCMHEEDAYTQTDMNKLMSFSFCKSLKAFD